MATITFDALKFADKLEKAGVSRELALVKWMLGDIISRCHR